MKISDAEFDILLTKAIYRAAKLDYCAAPTDDELDEIIHPSLRFRRRLKAMLSNHGRYIRSYRRPIYLRVLRTAAIFLIAFTVLLGAAMAVSPTVRAAVTDFVRSWFEDRTIYQTSGHELDREWVFEYIPEGFELSDRIINEIKQFSVYQDSNGVYIFIIISSGKQTIDNEHSDFYQTRINGKAADIYESNVRAYPNTVLVYDDRSDVFITLVSEIDIDEIIKIAEHIK
jgi:hypothetical protein